MSWKFDSWEHNPYPTHSSLVAIVNDQRRTKKKIDLSGYDRKIYSKKIWNDLWNARIK